MFLSFNQKWIPETTFSKFWVNPENQADSGLN
jgi:hypothetical protein